MNSLKLAFSLFTFVILQVAFSQELPIDKVVSANELQTYLKKEVALELSKDGEISIGKLAAYFREKFSERYFYDWRTFEERFVEYNQLYNNESDHYSRANDHMQKYADSTQWKLPFNYLNGTPVNAYAMRHLARQHKMIDIAYQYFYKNKDPKYISYFVNQRNSLNVALELGVYEKMEDGNGVYENFRTGYRALNWLRIHNMFLGQKAYSDEDQLKTVATLLQQGADLYANNTEFIPGNHQTRGVSALAIIAILLGDFEGTDMWFNRAMERLKEHMDKEVNPDGFQSERSVHYHMSDIGNYYYVYQLAKISEVEVDKAWREKLKSLFVTLVKIAYPDKSAPVLQDDTEIPWAENNDISGIVTLGYMLFEDPEFGYFVKGSLSDKMYWFVKQEQLELLTNVVAKKPTYGSLIFADTHYYFMREGWNEHDKMLVISAGLDAEKPSHQHGDMLGIQAVANGQNILPNYQVRYSLPDFDLFKNSLVKNVGLVDDELQGKQWTPNKGGTGYGQFNDLPQPNTIAWESNDDLDLFVGSHDGFKDVGVNYSRQVIYVKDDFWIVKDNFSSENLHIYKQVWQGHYSLENEPNLLRSTFNNGSGLDIFQINKIDEVKVSGKRGKEWIVVSKNDKEVFSFITILFPFSTYDKCLDIISEEMSFGNWSLNIADWDVEGDDVVSLSNENKTVFFSVKSLEKENIKIDFSLVSDVFLTRTQNVLNIQSLSDKESEVSFKDKETLKTLLLKPGETIQYQIK